MCICVLQCGLFHTKSSLAYQFYPDYRMYVGVSKSCVICSREFYVCNSPCFYIFYQFSHPLSFLCWSFNFRLHLFPVVHMLLLFRGGVSFPCPDYLNCLPLYTLQLHLYSVIFNLYRFVPLSVALFVPLGPTVFERSCPRAAAGFN